MRVSLRGDVVSDNAAEIYRFFHYQVCCPGDIRAALEQCPDGEEIIFEINSSGGSGYAGFEMYSLIRSHYGRTVAEIQSIAASAMSVITAACDTVLMSPVAEIMIHRASIQTEGNSREIKQAAQMLDTIDNSILNAYLEKAGEKSNRETLSRMMRNETFLTAQEAIETGLADGIIPDRQKTSQENNPETKLDDNSSLSDLFHPANTPANLAVARAANRLPPLDDLIRIKKERENPVDSENLKNLKILENSKNTIPCDQAENRTNRKETKNHMDGEQNQNQENNIAPTTAEELVKLYPMLTNQIASAAKQAERERIAEIDALFMPGFEQIIAEGKANPDADAGSVAREIIKAQRESGKNYLTKRDEDAENSHVNQVAGTISPDFKTNGQDNGDEITAAAKDAVRQWRHDYKNSKGGEA